MRDKDQNQEEANVTSFLAAGIALVFYLGATFLAVYLLLMVGGVVGR